MGTVCVLGAGHAGKLALAAARDAAATLVAVDVDAEALELVSSAGLCDVAVAADLRDPLAALDAVRAAGAPPADLTVVVVNASGCEPTAILLTTDEGTVLFFSMATSFSAAALAADGIGTGVRMVVGSGCSPDRGAYALELVRRSRRLREALGLDLDRGAAMSERAPGADALARPRRARPRQPHRRAHLSRGGPRRLPRGCTGSAATSTSSGAARSASTARSTRRSGR